MSEEVNLVFEDDVVKLTPFVLKANMKMVLDLIMKCRYTRVSREFAEKVLLRYQMMIWCVQEKKTSKIIGIVYLSKTPAGWLFDAYRDDELVKSLENLDYAFRAGKLVLDFAKRMTKKVLTTHAFENRGATLLCRRFGFKEDFITMKKEF